MGGSAAGGRRVGVGVGIMVAEAGDGRRRPLSEMEYGFLDGLCDRRALSAGSKST